jgi:hypothetical protein
VGQARVADLSYTSSTGSRFVPNNMDGKSAGHRLSFDEFKLYYESTEKVTDRRLETNRWNYSICVAMLVAIAVLTRWSLTAAALLWIGFASDATLAVMAILFCALWVGQIRFQEAE